MGGVSAPVGIEESSLAARTIVIGAVDGGLDRERQLASTWLLDRLHADERNANAPEVEAVPEHGPGKDIIVLCDLPGEPVEGGTTDVRVSHE